MNLTPNLPMAAAFRQRRVNAISTHYMALVRAAVVRRWLLHRGSRDDHHTGGHSENAQVANHASQQRPIKRLPASLGPLVGAFAPGGDVGVTLRRFWYGNRTRDSQIQRLVLYPLS